MFLGNAKYLKVRYQIFSQPFDREVGVDDSHQYADKKQQDEDLDGIWKTTSLSPAMYAGC